MTEKHFPATPSERDELNRVREIQAALDAEHEQSKKESISDSESAWKVKATIALRKLDAARDEAHGKCTSCAKFATKECGPNTCPLYYVSVIIL
jgi:hypothetical protein